MYKRQPKASHTLKKIMQELCEKGSAIFFSTHVLEVAEKLCNKIAIIKGGRLVACGETAQVKGCLLYTSSSSAARWTL